ncbi:MAG: LD-carboxypeptidase [Paramuribaculum sp.]|nr:LD-carboxypeptidase [Paramuribaculum sp.]
MLRPPDLRPGDTIAIISPAGIARRPATEEAADLLRRRGWNIKIMPHALGRHGSFSGTAEQRASDLREAITDPEIKAILCSRGGYGAVHLLDMISPKLITNNPKWLIGFSDISALHCLWLKAGVESIHGPMAKHILASAATESVNPLDLRHLEQILMGKRVEYQLDPHPLNHFGLASGTLIGGNFSVISALADTLFDPYRTPDAILFIEDINEPVYKIERLIYRLRLRAGDNIKGMIVGNFTGVGPDVNHASIYDMIHSATAPMHIPVAFAFPAGHGGSASPLILGSKTTLRVDDQGVVIS